MREDFFAGVRASVPACLGVVPVGISIGLLAVQAGLSGGEALLMSALVMAGSAQLMALGMLAQGAAWSAIIVGTFFINLRHLVMSASVMSGLRTKTTLPQRLPAAAAGRLRLHAKAEKFLRLIPYTAMAALLFPGILEVDPSRPEIGIAGGLAAGVLAWRGCPVILCVVSAIGVDLLLYLAG